MTGCLDFSTIYDVYIYDAFIYDAGIYNACMYDTCMPGVYIQNFANAFAETPNLNLEVCHMYI